MYGEAHRPRHDGHRGRACGAAAAVAACLALAGLLGAATAPAHKARFDTRVKIDSYGLSAGGFEGRVRSERKACKRKRVVVLWRKISGAPNKRIGRDRSDRRGRWFVSHIADRGTYYANARRRVIRRGGHRHVCKRDRSPDFVLRGRAEYSLGGG